MGIKNELVLTRGGYSLVEEIKKSTLPKVIWGCGSMSYSIRKVLENNGINIDAYWVDGSHASEINRIPVYDYPRIVEALGRFDVVCGHSRYDLVGKAKGEHSEIRQIYCLVNVCYGQWNRISKEFIEAHLDDYENAYRLMDDDLSRRCISAYLNCRNNEDHRFLLECCGETATYFDNPFFSISDHEVYLDVGAYNGDTVQEFIEATNGKYKRILAIEPETESFNALIDYVAKSEVKNIETCNNGSWYERTILRFEIDEESSGLKKYDVEDDNRKCDYVNIEVRRIDEQFRDYNISLMKINFLNGVLETLRGAEMTLIRDKPRLAITVGFDEWGLINIPSVIKRINPSYKLGLRYASPMPARLILFGY